MRILGVDPGIATVGFAVLDAEKRSQRLLTCGVITTPAKTQSLPKQPSRDVHVPTDGYHLPGCTWGNGPAGPRKVARITHNIKHDRRGERQMPDPGRQHRGREAFQPQPNEHRS